MIGFVSILYNSINKKSKIAFFHLIFTCCYFFGNAQTNVSVKFDVYDNENLVKVNAESDTLISVDGCIITALKMYITKMKFYLDDSLVFAPSNDAHLIAIGQPATCLWQEILPDRLLFNKVKFLIGVDSITHTLGPLDGALDPISGMYWTWQSGYINVKIEGKSDKISGKGHGFQYHIGGYYAAANTVQEITMPMVGHNLHIAFNLGLFLKKVDFNVHHIMSPSAKAAEVSKLIASCITNVKG